MKDKKPITIQHKYESHDHESLLGVTTHRMKSWCEEENVEAETVTHVLDTEKKYFKLELFQQRAAENNAKKIKMDVYKFRVRRN